MFVSNVTSVPLRVS